MRSIYRDGWLSLTIGLSSQHSATSADELIVVDVLFLVCTFGASCPCSTCYYDRLTQALPASAIVQVTLLVGSAVSPFISCFFPRIEPSQSSVRTLPGYISFCMFDLFCDFSSTGLKDDNTRGSLQSSLFNILCGRLVCNLRGRFGEQGARQGRSTVTMRFATPPSESDVEETD